MIRMLLYSLGGIEQEQQVCLGGIDKQKQTSDLDHLTSTLHNLDLGYREEQGC